MADKFLNTGGSGNANITNGTALLFGSSIGADNLDPSQPVKTNSTKQLISSKLDIADINSLQTTLDSVLTNPFVGTLKVSDLETDDYFSVDTELQKIDNFTASTATDTNITGIIKVPEVATGRIYDSGQSTWIDLDGSTVDISATDLTLNSLSLATKTYVDAGTTNKLAIDSLQEQSISGSIEITGVNTDDSSDTASSNLTTPIPMSLGFQFTIKETIIMTHFKFWVPQWGSANSTRIMHIYTDAGVLLHSATIDKLNSVGFWYETAVSPFALTAGTYRTSCYIDASDFQSNLTVSYSPHLSVLNYCIGSVSGLDPTFPNTTPGSRAVPGQFRFTTADGYLQTRLLDNKNGVIINVSDPINSQDVATKTYVDSADLALQNTTQNITGTAGTTTLTGKLISADSNFQDIYNASNGFSSMSIYATPLVPGTNNVKLNTGSIDIKFAAINLDGTANTKHLAPVANNLYDLGTSLLEYNTIHANKLTGLNAPVAGEDSANKNYVDTADGTLQTNITAEASTRALNDTVIINLISTESSNRSSAISSEATARNNSDIVLQNNILNETTARTNADTALTARIDNITDSTSLGEVLKPPGFTTAQRDTITTNQGMIIYNTDNNKLETTDGTYWSSVASTEYYAPVITPHDLTSNGFNSNFVVSSSSTQTSDTEAWKAFNGVFSDGFISAPGTYVLSTGLPTAADSFQGVPGSYLKISLNEPKVISKYQIAPFLVSSATRLVLQWRILTSMDNLTWTLAATQNTDYVYNNGVEVYSDDIVLTPVAAKYIIFQITKVSANQTLGDKALIAEINFDGTYLDGPVQIDDYTLGQDSTGLLMSSHSDGGMMILGNPMINAATSFSTCHINYSTMLPVEMLASITAASGGVNKCWGQTATYVADVALLAGRVVSLADQTNGTDNSLGLRVGYLKVGGVVIPGVSPIGITQHNCNAGEPILICVHGFTTAISLTAQVAKRGSVAMAGALDADSGKIRINTAAAVIQASIGFVAQSNTVGIDDPVLIYYSGFMQPT
jgi:hypothetical protein